MPAVPAIITAGAAITNAAIGAHSNNSSAKTQAAAATHAADVQAKATADALAAQKEEQAYERQQTAAQQQARAPYVNLSNSSLAAIAGKLGVPAPNFSTAATMPAARPTSTYQTVNMPAASASPAASGASTGSLASIYQPPSATANTMAAPTAQTTSTGTGGVKMIAPTGEVALVAPADVARAVSLGARVA